MIVQNRVIVKRAHIDGREFRIKLGKDIPAQALSGTQPPYIKQVILITLPFDETGLYSIKMSNIARTHATQLLESFLISETSTSWSLSIVRLIYTYAGFLFQVMQ